MRIQSGGSREGIASIGGALALVLALLVSGAADAQSEGVGSLHARHEWAMLAGVARGRFIGTTGSTTVTQGLLRYGVDLGRSHRVTMLFEAAPYARVAYGGHDDTHAQGFDVLVRYNLVRDRWRLGLIGGAGMWFSSSRIPEGASHVNFSPQAGVSLQRLLTDDFGLEAEYRFVHVSNAGLTKRNPGLNSHAGLFGLVWRR